MGILTAGGFHKCAYPNWMVYFMENPIKMDDDWGYTHFRKPPCGFLPIPYCEYPQLKGFNGTSNLFANKLVIFTMLMGFSQTPWEIFWRSFHPNCNSWNNQQDLRDGRSNRIHDMVGCSTKFKSVCFTLTHCDMDTVHVYIYIFVYIYIYIYTVIPK